MSEPQVVYRFAEPGVQIRERADELQFVDEDIREAFQGKMYAAGVPTMIQQTRTMKQLTEALKESVPQRPIARHTVT